MSRLPSLGPRGEGWVVAQMLVLGAVTLGDAGTTGWRGIRRAAATTIGAPLYVAGAALAARGAWDLRRVISPLPRPRDDADLVETGVYRHVRHPMYGGIILAATGWALLRASVVSLRSAAALAVLLELKSRREEAWLEERFTGYAEYRGRTHRLIPAVW